MYFVFCIKIFSQYKHTSIIIIVVNKKTKKNDENNENCISFKGRLIRDIFIKCKTTYGISYEKHQPNSDMWLI